MRVLTKEESKQVAGGQYWNGKWWYNLELLALAKRAGNRWRPHPGLKPPGLFRR